MKRHSAIYARDESLISQKSCCELSLEPTGRDGIAGDSIFTKFGSKRASEPGDTAFRGRIGMDSASSKNAHNGCYKNYPAMPLATHRRRCPLSQKKASS